MTTPFPRFDNYAICPLRCFERPGCTWFEPCKPHEADVWALYGHASGEDRIRLGHFDYREDAEDVAARILGVPFTGDRAEFVFDEFTTRYSQEGDRYFCQFVRRKGGPQ
jgi:hypothetical protein